MLTYFTFSICVIRFYRANTMLARYTLSSCVCLSVCLSARLPQAGIVLKRLDESSCFLAWGLPLTYPTLCCREIWVSSKIMVYFPLGLCPNSRLKKIWPRQVDRVVNDTRPRRPRQSSLLTTPIRQSTSRGCLLQGYKL